MVPSADALVITGATGLVGTHSLRLLLARRPELHAYVIVRDRSAWRAHALAERLPMHRVTALRGDVTEPGLGLDWSVRRTLYERARLVVHCAADTTFSRPLAEARVVNTGGTAHVLELVDGWPGVVRAVHLSTAFVAGRSVGRIAECPAEGRLGFVNGYEQSKYEAEELVRASSGPWAIVRPSAIVCDGPDGRVSQFNAVHRALRLYHGGLASMMPGDESNPVDVVSADYVARAVAELTLCRAVKGTVYHACSGRRALGLGELLDRAYAAWARSSEWRRRAIPRPALTDLETYRLFERSVEETGDARLRTITQSLSHFVPQLALPKTFETARLDTLLGGPPPNPRGFWDAMIRYLLRTRWAAAVRRAA